MEFLVVSALNGLIYGLLLFMVAAGLTLVFGMMGIVNFAHASFYMIGAYLAFTISGIAGFWVGLLVAPLIVAVIGMGVERFALRRVYDHGPSQQLLLTFGLAFVCEELIKTFYGNYPVAYLQPHSLDGSAFTVFGASYPAYRFFVGVVAVLMFATLYLLLHGTRIGIIVRAAVQRPAMVSALGHNVSLAFLLVFGVGAWMAGMAGAVGGALLTTSPTIAAQMTILAFVVVVVGGLGSLNGALLASVIIGLLTSFSVGANVSFADFAALFGQRALAEQIGGLLSLRVNTIAGSLPVLLMLLVLLTRPAGLLGERD